MTMNSVPTGFIPNEDMGSIMVDISTPSGYTMAKTEEIMDRATMQIQELPGVESVGGVVGMGGANRGMIYIQLTPWDLRTDDALSIDSITEQINEILAKEHEAESFAMSSGMIDGFGNGGFEFSIQNMNDVDIHQFNDISKRFVEALNARPEILDASSNFDANFPQYRIDVDPIRCQRLGVSPSGVLNELSAFLGSSYISNFNKYNQTYQVTMQLRPDERRNLQSLDSLFVRSESGQMLPISQFVTLTKEYMPQSLSNFNMISSIGVYGTIAPGYSSGDAIQAARELADTILPVGFNIEFGGITREEIAAGNKVVYIFIICIFFVYLVMVALYESLFTPMAVLLSVPFGLAGAFYFANLFNIQNDIYFQVGLLMLIGLIAKTAILLTEYASQCRQAGLTIPQSAFMAAKMRFRPILMTSMTMIIGMLPLMCASGVGSNGRRTIGTCIVGGMLAGTIGLIFIVPALFVIFQNIQEKFKKIEIMPTEDPVILAELKMLERN